MEQFLILLETNYGITPGVLVLGGIGIGAAFLFYAIRGFMLP